MTTKITNCQFCGHDHGVQCPAVKAIEYFPDGKIKRVEFKSATDYYAPVAQTYPTFPQQPFSHLSFPPPTTWGGQSNSRGVGWLNG